MTESEIAEEFVVEFTTSGLRAESPAAFFEGVSGVLDSLQILDANLLAFVLPQSRATQSIEEISIASLRLRIATLLENIPEEDLRGCDWRRIAGHFLVEGRKAFLRFLRRQPKVTDKAQLEELGREVDALVGEVTKSPKRFPRRLLLMILVRIIRSAQAMPGTEVVTVVVAGEVTSLPRDAEVTAAVAQEVAAAELEPFDQEMTLLIKKPDMIGRSQWEFVDRGHVIRAKMSDTDWVTQYQSQAFALNPGDAIEAKVRLLPRNSSGEDEYAYEVVNVRRVIHSTVAQQSLFFDGAPHDGAGSSSP